MSLIENIIEFNKKFVHDEEFKKYQTTKYPDKKMVILTCMDTRLLELLPKAMNIKNGDAKIIKNAGALVCEPFGSVMRSIIIAIYELQASEVCVIGHHDCGMANNNAQNIIEKILKNCISENDLKIIERAGIDVSKWLSGFKNVEESVIATVDNIQKHPLFPQKVPVHGLIMEPVTGKLDLIVNGYERQG